MPLPPPLAAYTRACPTPSGIVDTMPTLHAYTDGSGFYAKASLQGRVVTFQLTAAAVQRLSGAGLSAGSRLPAKLLLALIQAGDAYTGAAAAKEDPAQTALPFGEGELDVDGLLPRCEETAGHLELHLVVLDDGLGGGRKRAKLLAPEPRHVLRKQTVMSIPVSALSWRALEHLVVSGLVPEEAKAVAALRRWFNRQLADAWDELARQGAARQTGLVFSGSDELPLG
jgi:hypothetical protein